MVEQSRVCHEIHISMDIVKTIVGFLSPTRSMLEQLELFHLSLAAFRLEVMFRLGTSLP